jgi:endonuclease/exonuclease/phosphatase family metal-dependent hydrolase
MGADRHLRSELDGAAACTIRLLTLNLGLHRLQLPGGWQFPLVSHSERRLKAAPQLLRATGADVLALQEVYNPGHRRLLAAAMAENYPFSAEAPPTRLPAGNGLMFLSRFPISSCRFIPCRGGPLLTRLFWKQGFLAADIDLPTAGRTRFVNVHLAATVPFDHPEAAASTTNRDREISQLLSAAGPGYEAAILVGDFNTGPEICPDNYHRFIAAGYVDAFAATATPAQIAGGFTWDAANPLNAASRFRDSPRQRIDLVFVHKSRTKSLTPVATQIVLQDPVIGVGAEDSITLSDHYGMLVTLALSPH